MVYQYLPLPTQLVISRHIILAQLTVHQDYTAQNFGRI